MKDILSYEELKTLVLDAGVVTEKELELAEERFKSGNGTFAQALLWYNLISDEELGRLMADALHLPFVVLGQKTISEDILQIVPEIVAKKHRLIVFALDEKGVHIATADPCDLEIQNFLEKKTGHKIVVYFASERDIENAFSLYKKEVSEAFEDLIVSDLKEAGDKKSAETDPPIIRIVDTLIAYAYQNRASDIHIEPREKDMLVRFRVDGVLHDIVKLPPTLHPQIISRIKILSKLRTDEHTTPQDGKLQFLLEGRENLDVRVSIIPTTEGEKIVLRLLSDRSRSFSLTNLGFSPETLDTLKNAYQKPYGMILVTGPTGCGKTTTLYSILKLLNRRQVNIVTIEDPVEYDMEGISQIQVNIDANLTFATGLRSILRQDPNVILVGEIRDNETASIAINLAMTGHLVLSTLHTNTAATAIPRLIDMHIEPFLISSTTNIIVAERLVRKIHPSCRVSEEVESAELASRVGEVLFEKVFGKIVPGKTTRLYQGKGCEACHNTGYEGRTGIFEALVLDDAIREAIIKQEDADSIEKIAVASGMRTMFEDGLMKVQQGLTTIDEVLRVTKE
ncbi:MAG: GspE/PulE family protein [Candidatus Moraniibacteriota bacterium]